MLSFIVKEVIDISYSKLIKTIAAAVTEQTEKMIKAKTNSDRTFNAQISEIVNDNKCRIKYCGSGYTISSSIYCEENDWVRVCAPCDNWKELYVVENKTKGKMLRDVFSSIKELNDKTIKTADMSTGKSMEMWVGKLNDTQNYVQFRIDGIDKGYIIFDVSRNID